MNLKTQFNTIYQSAKEHLPGAHLPWLREQRESAMQHFNQQGVPTPQLEDWKYTPIDVLTKHEFKPKEVKTVGTLPTLSLPDDAVAERFVFVDGVLQPHLSKIKNILLFDLGTVLQQSPELLIDLMQRTNDKRHGFLALNTALMDAGYVLVVPNNYQTDLPIHIVHYGQTHDTACHLRNFILSGENSQVSIIEEYSGVPACVYLTNTVTHIDLAKDAQLTHYKLIAEGERAFHMGEISVEQQTGSCGIFHSFTWGGQLVRSDIMTDLLAPHATCQLNGLYYAKHKQHIDHHTTINHAVANCQSDEYYKGMIDDQACAVFNGRVIVAKDAQRTQSSQQNKNLLLSKQAQINTKPQLEIFADDVKCAHGATVGQLDTQALFYLRSRGMDALSAQRLLLEAFAMETIAKVPLATLRQALTVGLAQQLSNPVSRS